MKGERERETRQKSVHRFVLEIHTPPPTHSGEEKRDFCSNICLTTRKRFRKAPLRTTVRRANSLMLIPRITQFETWACAAEAYTHRDREREEGSEGSGGGSSASLIGSSSCVCERVCAEPRYRKGTQTAATTAAAKGLSLSVSWRKFEAPLRPEPGRRKRGRAPRSGPEQPHHQVKSIRDGRTDATSKHQKGREKALASKESRASTEPPTPPTSLWKKNKQAGCGTMCVLCVREGSGEGAFYTHDKAKPIHRHRLSRRLEGGINLRPERHHHHHHTLHTARESPASRCRQRP